MRFRPRRHANPYEIVRVLLLVTLAVQLLGLSSNR
jgi:hypothetical protein